VRVQVQKLLDGGLFGLALWLSHYIRQNYLQVDLMEWLGGAKDIPAWNQFIWLFFIIIPVAPLLLEAQGFYNRPLLAQRRATVWALVKAGSIGTLVLISLVFIFKMYSARSVILLFAPVSVFLVYLKEEIIRQWMQSRIGQAQTCKRLILVGSEEDCERLKRDLRKNGTDSVEIIATLNLNNSSVEALVQLLHEHSANGVLLIA